MTVWQFAALGGEKADMVGSDLLLCDNKICRKMCVCAGGDEKNGCFGMKDRIFGLECVTTRTYQDNLSLAVSKKGQRAK